jgi:hypothetical protein
MWKTNWPKLRGNWQSTASFGAAIIRFVFIQNPPCGRFARSSSKREQKIGNSFALVLE